MARVPTRARQLRYRLAFFVTALVTLALVVTLPFSVKSVVDDVLGPATGRVIPITPREPGRPDTVLADRLRSRDQNYTKLHLAVTSIDEVQLLATLRVSGHHRCAGCAWSRRVLLVALSDDDTEADGLPPSTAIKLAAGDVEISETVQLPLRGHPIHYPFDRYQMVLGIAYQRIYPGGTPQTLSRAQDGDHLFLSLQELLPRNVMKGPFPVDLQRLRSSDDPFDYAEAFAVTFERPARPRRHAGHPHRRRGGLLGVPPAAPRPRGQRGGARAWRVGDSRNSHALQHLLRHRRGPRARAGHHLRARCPHHPGADVRPR
jgi:hypothetical protein